MIRSEPVPIAVARRGSMPEGRDAGYTVVWVRGEHDIATKVSLVVAIARAAQRDNADVLVDLSEVTFMDASTIDALVGSRNRPLPARRVLELCDLADLVQPGGPRWCTRRARPPRSAPGSTSHQQRRSVDRSPDELVPSEERQPARLRPTGSARPPKATATIEVDRSGP